MNYFDHDIKEVLLDEETIINRVKEIGAQITADYQGQEIVAICILRGSLVFTADLIRSIDTSIILDTMVVSSYGKASKTSGAVKILKDLQTDIQDKHVLVIEDIVDTGLTLNYLVKNLNSREPASLKICAFLDKPERREKAVDVDYLGFSIPDEFVVGYGLDFSQKYRNYPGVAALRPEAYSRIGEEANE